MARSIASCRHRAWTALSAWLLLTVSPGTTDPASAQSAESGPWIEIVSKQAHSILTGPATSETERELELEALIVESFDLEALDRFALGRQARQLDEEQRSRFEQAFRGYAVRNFSRLIANLDGKALTVTKSHAISEQEALVTSNLGGDEEDRLNVGWLIHWKDQSPRIVDVYIEGISMALTLRHEFSAFGQKRGIDALVETLEQGSLIPQQEEPSRDAARAAHSLLQAAMDRSGIPALLPE